jgi:hypothetical protein
MSTLIAQISAHSTVRMISLQGTNPLTWPTKRPSDVFDYQIDLSGALFGVNGGYIVSTDIQIEPSQIGDLSLDDVAANGYVLVVWLSAGIANVTYVITIEANSSSGLTVQRSISLSVIS